MAPYAVISDRKTGYNICFFGYLRAYGWNVSNCKFPIQLVTSCLFNINYLYFYFQIIRSASVGGLCTLSRLGALLAPFVPLMVSRPEGFKDKFDTLKILYNFNVHPQSRYFKPLPLFIFGGSTFVAGLFALLLPETLGRKLPETVSAKLNLIK